MSDDFLVFPGGSLKSLSDTGKIGGFLVLFEVTDLESDYFTKDKTDYWLEGKSLLPLIWRHGLDRTIGRKRLTHVYHNIQDEGLWIEGKLPLRSSAEVDQIWDRVQKDEIGLSSGTAGHLVHKEFNPHRRANEIKSWPLTEASLTPQPVQPRSRAVALKSLPTSDFESLNPQSAEQRAATIYAETLIRGHELRMMGYIPSLHEDSRSEEQDYYNALAALEVWRLRQATGG